MGLFDGNLLTRTVCFLVFYLSVTEKVWESESTDCSEDERPPPPKKKPPPMPVAKATESSDEEGEEGSKKGKKKGAAGKGGKRKVGKTPPSKGKQSNLMSFFKKK